LELEGVRKMILANVGQVSTANIVVDLGIILLTGLVFGRLFECFKIPSITGYIVGGLLIGPIFNVIDIEELRSLNIITDVVLGFIAFQVGNELWFGKLRHSGMKILIITIFQAVITVVVVALALMPFTDLSVALVLGSIAAATAPAPIIMLIKKYRTKGELTDTILPVVGLDDAVGVIIFGILLSISKNLLSSGTDALNIIEMLMHPLREIGLSLGFGIIIGVVSGIAVKTINVDNERHEKSLDVVIIAVLLSTGAALLFHASPILTPMLAGVTVTNLINKECFECEEETIRNFIPPLMIAFFTLAGAMLQIDVVLSAGVISLVYIVARIFGKVFGAYLGARASKAGESVRKYLGVSLLPQSGVAIGLAVAAYNEFHGINIEYASVVKNVILASVLVFALIGPALVKYSFYKANEIR
jgi:Kef-type K+ transport system membrane component KefB